MRRTKTLALCAGSITLTLIAWPAWPKTAIQSWSKAEVSAYERRNFIELEQLMVEKHQNAIISKVAKQEADLRGCKALHRGVGGMGELISCMRFVNREDELRLKSRRSEAVIKDLSLLCERLIKSESDIRQLARSRVLMASGKLWQNCAQRAWRQVYLTAAARFDAEPVAVLSYVRTAESGLPHQCSWAISALKLIQEPQMVRHLK